MNSSIYKYYPTKDDKIHCIVCQYEYRKDAPLSTLQKHLRVKHNFSIRCPLSPQELQEAITKARTTVFSQYEGPEPKKPKAIKESPTAMSSTMPEEPTKWFNISEILNTHEPEIRRPAPLAERHIVKWVLKEKIPLSIATSDSFFEMLREINPDTVLPTLHRLRQLVTEESQAILGGEQDRVQVIRSSFLPSDKSP